jgi:hypothetical protein
MSMIRCEMCSRLIDRDDDPNCFVEQFWTADGDKDAVLCEPCRDKHLEIIEQ